MDGIRFLGRRLSFSFADYLGLPVSTFTKLLSDELEAIQHECSKPSI